MVIVHQQYSDQQKTFLKYREVKYYKTDEDLIFLLSLIKILSNNTHIKVTKQHNQIVR